MTADFNRLLLAAVGPKVNLSLGSLNKNSKSFAEFPEALIANFVFFFDKFSEMFIKNEFFEKSQN